MGSEGLPAVTVHVTGFKKFHGVAENPTEIIVRNLSAYMEKNGLPKGLVIGSCSVLETAGEGALPELYKIFEAAAAGVNPESSSGCRVILVFSSRKKATSRSFKWKPLFRSGVMVFLKLKGKVLLSDDLACYVLNKAVEGT